MVRTTSFLCSKLAASQGRRIFVATQTLVCESIDGETRVTAANSKKRRMEHFLPYDEADEFIRTNYSVVETSLPRRDYLPPPNKFAKLAENTNPTNNHPTHIPTLASHNELSEVTSSSPNNVAECDEKSSDLSKSVFAKSSDKGGSTYLYLTWNAKRALTNAMELVGPDAASVLKHLRDEHQFPLFVTQSMIQKVWKSHCLISLYHKLGRPPKVTQSGCFNIFVRIANGDRCLAEELMKIDHAQCVREFKSNKQQVQRILVKFKSK